MPLRTGIEFVDRARARAGPSCSRAAGTVTSSRNEPSAEVIDTIASLVVGVHDRERRRGSRRASRTDSAPTRAGMPCTRRSRRPRRTRWSARPRRRRADPRSHRRCRCRSAGPPSSISVGCAAASGTTRGGTGCAPPTAVTVTVAVAADAGREHPQHRRQHPTPPRLPAMPSTVTPAIVCDGSGACTGPDLVGAAGSERARDARLQRRVDRRPDGRHPDHRRGLAEHETRERDESLRPRRHDDVDAAWRRSMRRSRRRSSAEPSPPPSRGSTAARCRRRRSPPSRRRATTP